MRWRDLGHLARRFFGVLSGRGPTPVEQAEAAALLRPEEHELFWSQHRVDQRHGIEAARRVMAARPGARELARAALLHDVGKRHAGLGAFGRAWASGLALLRVPPRGRFRTYLDHGPIGARELEAAGAEAVVVAYAAHHTDTRPDWVPADDWAVLGHADRHS